jgi:hypothetical protein
MIFQTTLSLALIRDVSPPALIWLQEAPSMAPWLAPLFIALTCLSDSYLYVGGVANRVSIFLASVGVVD